MQGLSTSSQWCGTFTSQGFNQPDTHQQTASLDKQVREGKLRLTLWPLPQDEQSSQGSFVFHRSVILVLVYSTIQEGKSPFGKTSKYLINSTRRGFVSVLLVQRPFGVVGEEKQVTAQPQHRQITRETKR